MQPLGAPRQIWRWGMFLLIGWTLLWINGDMAASTARAQGEQPTATTPAEQSGTAAVTAESVQVRRVKVNFFINSIHTIDDENGSYAIDFWLDLFWRDPALEGKTVDDVDPARLWNPQVEAINSTDLTVLYQSYADSFEPDTNVYLSQRLVGTFTNVFNLRRFPFDRQRLVIALESSDFDSNRLLFDFMDANQAIIYSEKPFTFPLPIGKYISTEFALGEWSLTEANVVQQLHVLPYDKSTWAQLRIELQLQRHFQSYVLKIMLVFVFIMGLGATVFAIKLSELRYRLLAFFMLLLTAVTFDFTRLQRSPRTAYLTLLDLQALLCYFVLGIAILAVVLIALRNKSGAAVQAERLNRWVAVGYGVTIVLINLGLSWYGWRG
ncbi:MAG: hypothetical protein R3E79_47660 [Caldilineaceae bacterium]